MTDTDTRAALDAATLALIEAATEEGKAWGLHSLPSGDDSTYADYSRANEARGNAEDDIKAAITAHVEAEVARRLAVADSVDDAGPDGLAEVEAEQVASIERLRAAIAADRERAVAEATDGAVQGERFAAAICRLVGARETGTGGQTVDACTASLYADAAKRIERMLARDKARPTPDEARRMINELIGSMAVVGNGLDDSPGAVVAKRIAADARKALLRALGVEA